MARLWLILTLIFTCAACTRPDLEGQQTRANQQYLKALEERRAAQAAKYSKEAAEPSRPGPPATPVAGESVSFSDEDIRYTRALDRLAEADRVLHSWNLSLANLSDEERATASYVTEYTLYMMLFEEWKSKSFWEDLPEHLATTIPPPPTPTIAAYEAYDRKVEEDKLREQAEQERAREAAFDIAQYQELEKLRILTNEQIANQEAQTQLLESQNRRLQEIISQQREMIYNQQRRF